MARQRRVEGLFERLVLGELRPVLGADEDVVAWAHVYAPEDRRPGLIVVTSARCIVHWPTPQRPDVLLTWEELTAWRIEGGARGESVVVFESRAGQVAVRLPTSSKGRVRRATLVLGAVATLAPSRSQPPPGAAGGPGLDLVVERRGVVGHARRVVVSALGVLLILLGVVFASPFVPGPGLLTILAGLAILATEYEWAKDLHHWLRRHVERFRQRLRERRQRRRGP